MAPLLVFLQGRLLAGGSGKAVSQSSEAWAHWSGDGCKSEASSAGVVALEHGGHEPKGQWFEQMPLNPGSLAMDKPSRRSIRECGRDPILPFFLASKP